MKDIYLIVNKENINRFEIVSKEFNKSDIKSFLKADYLDFSDKAIISIYKDNDFILFTNDKDFSNSELDILTSNSNIILK